VFVPCGYYEPSARPAINFFAPFGALAGGPQSLNSVSQDFPISREEHHGLDLRLSNQHSVKRIGVMIRQLSYQKRMPILNSQDPDLILLQLGENKVAWQTWQGELAELVLDGYFPRTRNRKIQVIFDLFEYFDRLST
jgi:hypothetical protein